VITKRSLLKVQVFTAMMLCSAVQKEQLQGAEDEGTDCLKHQNYQPNDTASHPRRLVSLATFQ